MAHRLQMRYYLGEPAIDPTAEPGAAITSGLVRLCDDGSGLRAAAAPRGEALKFLLDPAHPRRRLSQIAICSRQRLGALIRAQSGAAIAAAASMELGASDASLSASSGPTWAQIGFAGFASLALAALGFEAPELFQALVSILLWLVFAGALWLRTLAIIAGQSPSLAAPPPDDQLPIYTVIVALYREAPVVAKLVRALDALHYPRAKLDIKLVLERSDRDTLAALAVLRLPARYDVIIAPQGAPLTKPRALNIALSVARGSLLVVYDAEDVPAPDQLRLAAARFAADPAVDCLQARLVIENWRDSWLSAAFALEYAVLFDMVNPGLVALDLPIALGGSSNHFRTATLRRVCGWDAWNVTEDADLGLRLARFGAQVGTLASDTREEAPNEYGNWFRQRMRWQKGWMQTLIVHSRRPARLWDELGLRRLLAVMLLLAGALLGGLFGPILLLETLIRAFREAAGAREHLSRGSDVITYILALWGFQTIVVPAVVAIGRRRLKGVLGALFAMPAYYALVSLATWAALFELVIRPFHWSKTEHGRTRGGPARARVAVKGGANVARS